MINCCWSSHLVLMRNSKVLNMLTRVLTTSLMLQMRMKLGNGWAWSQGEKFVGRGNIYYGLEGWKSLDRNKTFIPPAFVENTAQFTAIILVMVTKNQKNLHAEKQPASQPNVLWTSHFSKLLQTFKTVSPTGVWIQYASDYHRKQVSKVNNNQEGVLRDGGPQGKSCSKKMVEIKGMVRMEEWYLPSAHVHMSQNVPDRTNWKSQKPWFYLIPPELLAWEPSLKVSVPRPGPQSQPKMLLQVRSLIARILKPTQTGSIFPVFLLIFHSKKQN